jgi:hypothetical protein
MDMRGFPVRAATDSPFTQSADKSAHPHWKSLLTGLSGGRIVRAFDRSFAGLVN